MARYEIDIPASDATGFALTARINAATWTEALRISLTKLEGLPSVQNLLVDILDDNSMRVTEPMTRRSYNLRQIVEQAPMVPPPDPGADFAQFLTPPPPPSDAVEPTPVRAPVVTPAPVAPMPVAPPAPVVVAPVPTPAPVVAPIDLRKAAPVARTPSVPVAASEPASVPRHVSKVPRVDNKQEETLSSLFERCQDVYQRAHGVEDAAEFFMDLALEHVPGEAGAVFISEINRNDVYFAAARGPKAEQVKQLKVPLGQGYIGFSIENGVGIAVSDVGRDPRGLSAASQTVGYAARSLICTPAQKDGRVYGGIEVLNKQHGQRFDPNDLEVLNYLSDRLAEYLDHYYARQ